jgi:hypothetical protein
MSILAISTGPMMRLLIGFRRHTDRRVTCHAIHLGLSPRLSRAALSFLSDS